MKNNNKNIYVVDVNLKFNISQLIEYLQLTRTKKLQNLLYENSSHDILRMWFEFRSNKFVILNENKKSIWNVTQLWFWLEKNNDFIELINQTFLLNERIKNKKRVYRLHLIIMKNLLKTRVNIVINTIKNVKKIHEYL